MNKLIKLSLLTAGILSSAPAFSAIKGNLIVGGGLGLLSGYSTSSLSANANVSYPMHFLAQIPKLAIGPELRVLFGFGDQDKLYSYTISSIISVAGIARYHISPALDVYGGVTINRVGYSWEIRGWCGSIYSGNYCNSSDSFSDIRTGLSGGATYFFNKNLGVDARTDFASDIFTINGGVVYKF